MAYHNILIAYMNKYGTFNIHGEGYEALGRWVKQYRNFCRMACIQA